MNDGEYKVDVLNQQYNALKEKNEKARAEATSELISSAGNLIESMVEAKYEALTLETRKRRDIRNKTGKKSYGFPFWKNYFIYPIQKTSKTTDTGLQILDLSTGQYKVIWTAPGIPIMDDKNLNLRTALAFDIPTFEINPFNQQLLLADLGLISSRFQPVEFQVIKIPKVNTFAISIPDFMKESTKAIKDIKIDVKEEERLLDSVMMDVNALLLLQGGEQAVFGILKKGINIHDKSTNISVLYATMNDLYRQIWRRKTTRFHEYIIDYLIENRVDLDSGVNPQNLDKINYSTESYFLFKKPTHRFSTPFLRAVAHGDLAFAERLLKAGANVKQKNILGEDIYTLIEKKKLKNSKKKIEELKALVGKYDN